MLKIVEKYKDSFKNYDQCRRLAEIMDIRETLRKELFYSWYSNWFIFMPIFFYKMHQYDKKIKVLDNEFDELHEYLNKQAQE